MEELDLVASGAALVVALASFVFSLYAYSRSSRAEEIKNLLGEKETVSFGALKVLRDGLPKRRKERQLIIAAIMQACLLERSDRARALLFRVIEEFQPLARQEFLDALSTVEKTYASMVTYGFEKEELDRSRGKLRLTALRKILKAQ